MWGTGLSTFRVCFVLDTVTRAGGGEGLGFVVALDKVIRGSARKFFGVADANSSTTSADVQAALSSIFLLTEALARVGRRVGSYCAREGVIMIRVGVFGCARVA